MVGRVGRPFHLVPPPTSPTPFPLHPNAVVPDEATCCARCAAAAGCTGWNYVRSGLDCSAFGGSTAASACYLIADSVLAFDEPPADGVTTTSLWV